MKALNISNKIYSVRSNNEIKIKEIKLHHSGDMKVITDLGESSLSEVYKWGSNISPDNIAIHLLEIEKHFTSRVKDAIYYCDHLKRLEISIDKNFYSCVFNIFLNGNILVNYEYKPKEECILQFKKRFYDFLDGFKYGLIINGRK